MKGRIHSLESFGTVDGPGIRFVVFFQGCPMRCLYCHNPDSWDIKGGSQMDTKEILDKADSVREFLRGGGITATGGEPLMQPEFLTELFRLAKEQYDFHTCLDTSGITFTEKKRAEFDTLMKYTDLVMLDIKHIDPDEHMKLTSQKQDNVIAFAKYLSDNGIPIWIRHVLVPGITQNDEYLYKLGRFIGTLHTLEAVDILPYHDMGKTKYEMLGMEYKLRDTPIPTKEDTEKAREIVMKGVHDAKNQD
ncbi:MAG: pyruvate formate lyase-activating protein [Oscillospiraceae bacterium]|nr:pyruvate formate lyase-activating protein [Oscillospiraceae bacterium]